MQPALTVADEENKVLQPRKRRLPYSFIVGGLVILAAVIYLVYANTQATAAYYMTVAELRHCTTCTAQSVRVAGIVQMGLIVRDDAKQEISFRIADGSGGQPLSVIYSGIVPDIFASGIQVVVEGHYSGQGVVSGANIACQVPFKIPGRDAYCSPLKRGRKTRGQPPLPLSTRIHPISEKVKWLCIKDVLCISQI